MSTTPISSPTPSIPSPTGTDPLANKSTFLQLLVSQLKNQNPLNPADGTQFVTQLAQFTSLEQSLEMNTSLKAIRDALTATPVPATEVPSTTTTK
jgi:flagellar basal-body rod modification protein FlgD